MVRATPAGPICKGRDARGWIRAKRRREKWECNSGDRLEDISSPSTAAMHGHTHSPTAYIARPDNKRRPFAVQRTPMRTQGFRTQEVVVERVLPEMAGGSRPCLRHTVQYCTPCHAVPRPPCRPSLLHVSSAPLNISTSHLKSHAAHLPPHTSPYPASMTPRQRHSARRGGETPSSPPQLGACNFAQRANRPSHFHCSLQPAAARRAHTTPATVLMRQARFVSPSLNMLPITFPSAPSVLSHRQNPWAGAADPTETKRTARHKQAGTFF